MGIKTKHLSCLALIGCIMFAACGPEGRQPEDGFDFKDNEDRQTTLVGLVLNKDKTPASDVQVYVRKGDKTYNTSTDTKGRFVLEADIVGQVELILNDGRGFGAVVDVTLFEGGQNDLGIVSLIPLETIERIVDIFGVGFEERVTREAGNYQRPVYNTDASRVFAARKKNSEQAWDIVSVDTQSGQETLLVKDVHLERYYSSMHTPERPQREQFFELLLDRYLYYAYNYFNEDKQRRFGHVLLDTVSKKIVFDSVRDVQVQYTSPQQEGLVPVALGQRIYLPLNVNNLRREDFPSEFKKRKVFFIFDTQTQILTQSEELAPYWHSSLRVLDHDDQHIIYSGWSLDGEQSTYVFDAKTNESTNLRSGGKNSRHWQVLSGDGQVVVLENKPSLNDLSSTHIVSLRTGTINVFEWTMLAAQDRVDTLAVNHDGSEAIVASVGRDLLNKPTLYALDTTMMSARAVSLEVQHNGQTHTICDGEGDAFTRFAECAFFYDGSGRLLARGVFKDNAGQWYGADIHDALQTSRAVVYPLVIEPSWNELFTVPEHILTSTQNQYVRILRQPNTGFSQVYTDDGSRLVQRTYLSADHHDMAMSGDGKYAFYFASDPISGYEQLFRINLRLLK